MRIACSRCQAQYNLPDEKLERGAAKIRCTQCGHVFVVRRRSAEPPPVAVRESSFDDLQLEPPAASPSRPSLGAGEGTNFGDFDLGSFENSERPAAAPLPGQRESSFGDFDLGSPEKTEPTPPPSPAAAEEFNFGDFDLGSSETTEPRQPPSPAADDGFSIGSLDLGSIDLAEPQVTATPGTTGFDDFGLSDPQESTEPPPPVAPREASFEDFQFGSFDGVGAGETAAAAPGPAKRTVGEEKPEEEGFFSSTDELPALGELDLGEFDDGGANLGFDKPSTDRRGRDEASEPAERVRREDLVSASTREVPLQGLAEDIPRLDLQKGPRKAQAGGKAAPLLARDRRRSPLYWVVAAAVLATGGLTGYNAYRHPEALTFLNPQRIRELWRNRDVEAKFATEDVKGYGQDLPGGRRVFVIRGRVVNNSGTAQGLIRVKGNLFGRDGSAIATREVYCGNLLSDHELAALPRATIEARLQNQVGEALSNVDIAPGGKVPFMVVFPAPSGKVENFNVLVSAWRAGSGS